MINKTSVSYFVNIIYGSFYMIIYTYIHFCYLNSSVKCTEQLTLYVL